MALGAVFFSLPAALIASCCYSFALNLGALETLGLYSVIGQLMLLTVTFAVTLAGARAR